MNTNKIYAEHIANEYSAKKESKVIALKKLDRKVKKPAKIFAYTNGIIMSLVLGVGMCLSMKVIGNGSTLMFVLGIIVDCGFTSGYDEISYISKYKYHVPAFYTIPYIRHLVKRYAKYDILTPCIKEDNNSLIPALFIHGTADNFVPTYMSEENYQRYKGKKELLLIKNARHAWSLRTEQIKYESKVISFINDLTK